MKRLLAPLQRAARCRLGPLARARPTVARRLGAAALLGALGLASGLALAAARPSAVVAEAHVLLSPLAGNAFSTREGNTLVDLETEAELPRSDVVVALAAKADDAPDPSALRSRLSVRLAPGTEVMVVSYRAPSAERAIRQAVAVSEATLAERAARAEAALAARADWLGTAIGSTEAEITAASMAGDEVGVAVLTRRLALLDSQLAGLTLEAAGPGEVLGTTVHRDRTSALLGWGLALGGLAAGALAGLFLAGRCGRLRGGWRPGLPGPPGGRAENRGDERFAPEVGSAGGEVFEPLEGAAATGAHVERAARAGALSLAGAGVSAVGGIALTAALTNGLDRSTAGTVFSITSLFLVATAVVQLGTEVGLVRWLPALVVQRRLASVRPVIRMALVPVLGAAVAAALVGLVFAEDVAGAVGDGSGAAVAMVRVVAICLPVAAAYQVLLAATRGLRTMRPTVVVEGLGRTLVQLALVVLAILAGWGATVVVVAWALPYAAGLVVTVGWLAALLRRRDEPGGGRSPLPVGAFEPAGPAALTELRRAFWRFTGPRAVGTVAQMALKRLDIVLVAALRSPGEAALYAAATRFVVFGQLGVQALQQALSPQLSALFAAGNRDGVRDVYRAATAWTMLLAWPVYLVTAVLAPELLLLFGDGYTEVSSVVVLLSLAMLAATASGAVDVVLLMSGHTWLSLGNNLGAMIVNLGLNLLLIPRYGAVGAGVAWTIAIVLRNLLPLVQIRVLFGISPVSRQTAFVALSGAACLGVAPGIIRMLGAPVGWVVAALVAGMVVFVVSAWLARATLRLDGFVGMLRARRTSRAGRLDPATP